MRKLAPVFVMTSMLALAGTALATPSTTPASPTVGPNTSNPNNMSYSDKSGTSPGTNAAMDDKSKPMGTATTDDDKNMKHTAKKKAKKNVAMSNDTMKHDAVKHDAMKSDASVSASAMTNPSTKTTDGAAANSTTGRSAGQ